MLAKETKIKAEQSEKNNRKIDQVFISGIIETKRGKVEHDIEIHDNLKNEESGKLNDWFIDNHYVPRMRG